MQDDPPIVALAKSQVTTLAIVGMDGAPAAPVAAVANYRATLFDQGFEVSKVHSAPPRPTLSLAYSAPQPARPDST